MAGKKQERKGQSTVELGIFAIIIFMVLGFLFQQGFLQEQKQRLQMYSHREAMRLAQQENRRVSLTVMRFVSLPNFLGSIERVPIVAAASAEWNPRYEWISQSMEGQEDGAPQDTSEVSYLQIGDEMMQHGDVIKVPVMKMSMDVGGKNIVDYQSVSFIDQAAYLTSTSRMRKDVKETSSAINLSSEENTSLTRLLKQYVLLPGKEKETIEKIKKDMESGGVQNVEIESIPSEMEIISKEKIVRKRKWNTPK